MSTTVDIQLSDDGLGFARAITDAVGLDCDALLYLLEKPWKYADEWSLWLELDRPQDGDARWDEFLAALETA
jgi:hypothetical protein